MTGYSGARPTGGFEALSWLFMRISGIVLLVMAVFHLLLMHYVIEVDNLTFAVVAERWEGPWWRLYDFFLLAFALTHGVGGARIVIDDYVPAGRLASRLEDRACSGLCGPDRDGRLRHRDLPGPDVMPPRVQLHQHDAIVVGGGGAGLTAAVYLARQNGLRTAVVSKLHPVRSHTGAAQGGIGAALGNVDPEGDSWEWHMFDTVKGSDYLADQNAVEILTREAIELIYELEHMGLPFSRTPDSRIAQRRFGGHTMHFGKAPVRRSCYAADRTGHMILQTLYQQCVKHNVEFFDEYHVIDLIFDGRRAHGVVAFDIDSGELHIFRANAVLFATGGFGRMFQVTSNAITLTGDGPAILWRNGLPLQDMEFFQFHPTGIYKLGILITEGVRGEGVGCCATTRASASWSATPRTSRIWRPVMSCRVWAIVRRIQRGSRHRRKALHPPRRDAARKRDHRAASSRHRRFHPHIPGGSTRSRTRFRCNRPRTTRWAVYPQM